MSDPSRQPRGPRVGDRRMSTCLRCVRLDLLACRDCAPHLMHPVTAAATPTASETPPAIRAGGRWIDLDDYEGEPERTWRK